MKKNRTILIITVFVLISTIPLQSTVKAQTTPSYVGISVGDNFVWEIKLNDTGLDLVKDGFTALKDDVKDELGSYGDLNFSAALRNITTRISSFLFPEGWENMTLPSLFNETMIYYIESLNDTVDTMDLSDDWRSYNLTKFLEEILVGFKVENYTFFEFIDYILNSTQSSLNFTQSSDTGRMLPGNWMDINLTQLIIWEMNNFLNKTIFFGNIETLWQDLNYSTFISYIIPGIESDLIDFLLYIAYRTQGIPLFNWSMSEALAMLNATGPIDMGWTFKDLLRKGMDQFNSTMAENVSNFIPSTWETDNVSSLFEHMLEKVNQSFVPGLLDLNISYFLDEMKSFINISLYNMSLHEVPFGDLVDTLILNATMGFNNTIMNASGLIHEIPDWDNLSLNQLIDEFWGILEDYYGSYVTNAGESSPLYGFLNGMKFKFVIDHIGSEEIVLPGVHGVQINFTMYSDLGTGSFAEVDKNEFLPMEIPWIILNPADYNTPIYGLADQAMHSMLFFIGSNFPTEAIDFKHMEFDLPDPFSDVIFDLNWDNKGMLASASLSYGTQTVLSISQTTDGTDGDEIPGFEIPIILGLSTSTIIGIIYIVNKKKIKL